MVKRRRPWIIIAILCLCLPVASLCVSAASTADATEPIDVEKQCELNICLRSDGEGFDGISVSLYKIAVVSAEYQYSLVPEFDESGLELNGIQTVGEWNVVRATLESCIFANGIEENASASTDENGIAHFESLKAGLYLVIADQAESDGYIYSFDSALVSLPNLDSDGNWNYNVEANAKYERVPVDSDEPKELKVVKLWKGDDGEMRPESIEIEIFRNGTSYQTVILSDENNWTYVWSVKDDGADWKVVERNIPEGYVVTVEERDSAITLTNTYTPDPPEDPPQTGDSRNILLYIILMSVSGILIIILGIAGKKEYGRS